MSLAMLGTTEKFQLITLDMLDSHPSIYYSNVICMSQITQTKGFYPKLFRSKSL